MVEIIVPVALFLSLAFATVGVTRVISDGRTRRRLLESNASAELATAVVARPQADIPFGDALKWGFLLGSIGLALVIVQFLPYDADDPIMTGIVMLFAAAGLLAYYVTARRLMSGIRTPLIGAAAPVAIETAAQQSRLA
jgi:hypothetical protein